METLFPCTQHTKHSNCSMETVFPCTQHIKHSNCSCFPSTTFTHWIRLFGICWYFQISTTISIFPPHNSSRLQWIIKGLGSVILYIIKLRPKPNHYSKHHFSDRRGISYNFVSFSFNSWCPRTPNSTFTIRLLVGYSTDRLAPWRALFDHRCWIPRHCMLQCISSLSCTDSICIAKRIGARLGIISSQRCCGSIAVSAFSSIIASIFWPVASTTQLELCNQKTWSSLHTLNIRWICNNNSSTL